MSYCTIADMITRYGEPLMIRLSSDIDPEINEARLQLAIDDGAVEIDSYIHAYLPLATDVPRLRLVNMEIALYQLYVVSGTGTTDDVQSRYDNQLSWLKRVADGKISIGSTPSGTPAEETLPAEITSADRVFTASSMSRW